MAVKKAASKSKALVATKTVVVLPAETPDETLVEEAVAFIRGKTGEIKRNVAEIGQWVLDKFFDGDPEKVSSKNPKKDASYAALVERCGKDLSISKTTLSNWVGIALMSKSLPAADAAFKQLPSSYQEALLPLRDANKAEELAGAVAANNWSQRDLRKEVAKERFKNRKKGKKGKALGRHPVPSVIKALNSAARAFSSENDDDPFASDSVKELKSIKKVTDAIEAANTMIGQLNKLVKLLETQKKYASKKQE